MNKTPLVSVCMVSYNQEKYIGEALDSVLTQKTTFPFEVIVSDDCSKDTTPTILAEYASKYDNVRPIIGDKNIGYPSNQKRSLEAAQGKYIALCDSDDYWTDPYKLQKQVDYLESHPDCAICFHNVMHIYDGEVAPRSLLNPLDFPTELTIEDVISRKWFLPTNSEVFRAEYLEIPDWYNTALHFDYIINTLIARKGKLHYLPDIMAVYRHTAQSVNAAHNDGEYGYMLFHTQTMRDILTKLKPLLARELCGIVDRRLDEYNQQIAYYEREHYYEKHALLNYLRPKTYKRKLKQFLKRKL